MEIDSRLVEMLQKRGVSDINSFIHPQYTDLADPFSMHDMHRAVDRILQAVNIGEQITIYADYDADGIPGSVILSEFFTALGYKNFTVYLPHRHDEGYGIHLEALDTLASGGTTLLITIDVGCGARSEVVYAQSLGIDVIVTDHHEIPIGEQPECIIVHPKLGNYADPMLCGCAVIFRVICACLLRLRAENSLLVANLPIGWEKWMLDMVGLSTLADMVPLVNENRILAWYGLQVMRKSRRIGFTTLCMQSRVNIQTLDEQSLTFRVVPRINAASRMAHPMAAYHALSATDYITANTAVALLTRLNDERRKVVDNHMKTAHDQAIAQSDRKILWIGDNAWHIGVLSIIAGRLAEQYQKPVFVWAGHSEDIIKGSLRSFGGVNMLQVMMQADKSYFVRRGGHAFAGGFTMYNKNQNDMLQYLDSLDLLDFIPTPEIEALPDTGYDLLLSCRDITLALVSDLEKLQPWGIANPKPRICIPGAVIVKRTLFGKTSSHEKIYVTDSSGGQAQILLFNSDKLLFADWLPGQAHTLMVSLERSGEGRWEEPVLRPL